MDHARTTMLLNRLGRGEAELEEELLARLHEELRALAATHMARQRPDHTLQPTALVNEAWLRIAEAEAPTFEGRRQFFALASRVMRSVLVDHARQRGAQKRGGGRLAVELDGSDAYTEARDVDLLALDEALDRLRDLDPKLAEVVEMRFFGGLEHGEIASVLEASTRTIQRHWRIARAWLHRELSA